MTRYVDIETAYRWWHEGWHQPVSAAAAEWLEEHTIEGVVVDPTDIAYTLRALDGESQHTPYGDRNMIGGAVDRLRAALQEQS